MAVVEGKYKAVITAVIFVAMEVAAVVMLSYSTSLKNIWINRISHRVIGSLWSSGENIRNYFSLDEQNRELAQENIALSNLIRETRQNNDFLEAAAAYDSLSGNFLYIPATIVKASRNGQQNYIILDKGTADGVKENDGIITANGVIGIVKAVDQHLSYGLSFMNPNVSISTRMGRDGSIAPLEWDGKSTDGAVLKNIPLHHDLAKGDTLWTSGFSSIFPPDIPVGMVVSERLVDGSRREAEVVLFQDFGRIRYVAIAENINKEVISSLEKEAQHE